MNVAEFLNARYEEEETVAQLAAHHRRTKVYTIPEGYVMAPPEHLLADIAAKRTIVTLHEPESHHPDAEGTCSECGTGTVSWGPGDPGDFEPTTWPCPTLLALVQQYARHADFDPEWSV